MKEQLESSPLVVLIHAPHVVDASCPELFTDKSAGLAVKNFGVVVGVHIVEYELSDGNQ